MSRIKTDLKKADALLLETWDLFQTPARLTGTRIDECMYYPLPKPISGDYYFEVFLYETLQEASIRAVPCNRYAKLKAWNFFWYRPFEMIDFPEPRDLLASLCSDLHALSTRKSRILQEKSTLVWTYHAQTLLDNSWQTLYSVGCLRRKKNQVPLPDQATWCYQSDPAIQI